MHGEVNEIPPVVPIFPLPNVVLFPKLYLPLHIFEPRYREMVRDSLASSGIIAMVLLKSGWEENYYSNPEIYHVGCAGKIVRVNALPDGKYDIVLYGLEEVNFGRELLSKSYRQAEVERARRSGHLREGSRRELQQTIRQYLTPRSKGQHPGWSHELLRLVEDAEMDDEQWVNIFSFSLDLSYLEKQSLLEAGSLDQRGEKLKEILEFNLAEQSFLKARDTRQSLH